MCISGGKFATIRKGPEFQWRAGVLERINRMDGLAACWILLITTLLAGNLSNAPLWRDEAESALNALTLSSSSLIPKGSADGNPALLHEMSLYYKTDDPKYEYLPTHFLETPYVTIHGWLPYYFIRLGMGIFGKNELGPRFFSVIFFGLGLAVLYVMVREIASPALALCVVGYCSLMPSLLGYAMQARYYSYTLFFNLLGVFSFWRFTQSQSRVRFGVWAASEVFLYYTYISAFFLHQAVFALFVLASRRDLLKKFTLYGAFVVMFALPHLLVTKFPILALKIPARHSVDIESFLMLFSALERNWLLVLSAVAFLLVFIIRKVKNTLCCGSAEKHRDFDSLCFLLVVIGYPYFSYTSPEPAFWARIFLPVIPFVVYAALSRISPGGDRNRSFKKLRVVVFACIFLFLLVNPTMKDATKIPDLFVLKFKPNQGQLLDSKWVFDVLKHVESTGARNPLILTSFDHFVFAYYSDYEAELVWPLRKEYIDRLDRDFFIVVEDSKLLLEHCVIFLPKEKPSCLAEGTMKHFPRAAKLPRTDLGNVRIYQHAGGFSYPGASRPIKGGRPDSTL